MHDPDRHPSALDAWEVRLAASEVWGAKLRLLELASRPLYYIRQPEVREELARCRDALEALENLTKGEDL